MQIWENITEEEFNTGVPFIFSKLGKRNDVSTPSFMHSLITAGRHNAIFHDDVKNQTGGHYFSFEWIIVPKIPQIIIDAVSLANDWDMFFYFLADSEYEGLFTMRFGLHAKSVTQLKKFLKTTNLKSIIVDWKQISKEDFYERIPDKLIIYGEEWATIYEKLWTFRRSVSHNKSIIGLRNK